ncbi:MAG TPA: TIGR01777 family oxidoreductase [Candidatus Methylomirabilis sp.]|nr:TIGR01777 family oxidoreductase [Candidatus Methylomirabilis sp.]
MRIVIAGANGHVGNVLARYFHSRGDSVVVLARTTYLKPWRVVAWDGEHLREWMKELEGADAVINLVGRSVDCRYSAAHRREILESRVRSTRLLGVAIAKLKNPPRVWLNASTATIYRHALDRAMDERTGEIGGNEADAPATWRFSIEVATKWEESFFAAYTPKTRKVALRSAMIMSPDRGGIFDTLLRLVRFGLGGPAGSGAQYVSWIHEEDFARAIAFLIAQEEIEGAVNVAAPEPLPNREFMLALRRAWGARMGLAAKGWILRVGAVLLRTETELILKSRRVVPGRLLEAGFRFQFPYWRVAAKDLVRRWRLRLA